MLKKKYVFLMLAAVCILSAAVLMGCSSNSNTEAQGTDSYSVTDIQGTVVDMPAKPQRILTLSMSTDEVMLGLVTPDKMVAVNELLDDPVSSNVTGLVKGVKGRITNPSAEEIMSLNPDLVIVPDWGDITVVNSLRDLGLKVVVCKGAKNLAEIKETIKLLGEAVGEKEKGEKLISMMDEHLEAIQEKTAKIPQEQKKTVVLISLMKSYGGIGCSFDEACNYAGVTNGMAKLGIRYGQAMTKEQLVEINPDILFLPTYTNNGTYDINAFRNQYLNDPALSSMKSIQNKSFKEPNESYIYNCSQDFVLGVQEIAYMAYGDEFKQEAGRHLSAVE